MSKDPQAPKKLSVRESVLIVAVIAPLAWGFAEFAAGQGSPGSPDITQLKTLTNAVNSPPQPGSASGGLTWVNEVAVTNTAVVVDAAAGQLYVPMCDNPNSGEEFLHVADVASGATPGTTASKMIPLQPGLNSGFAVSLAGLQFTNGISAWASSGAASSNATAPTNAINCDFAIK